MARSLVHAWTRRLLVVLLLTVAAACEVDTRRTFAIATGGPAGLYYPIGGGMASIWSRHLPGVNAKAEVTGGSVTNVIQVARKESELGIAMADVVTDAYRGSGRFPHPLPLRVLLTAYPNIVHLLTLRSSGITRVEGLRGRRVSLGAAGSGTAVAAENVLLGLDLTLEQIAPVYLSFGETTSALKDGTIDAGFVVGGLGLAAVTELAVTRDMLLVPLSDVEMQRLVQRFPAYSGYTIPANAYHGVAQPVQALGIWSAVVVHEDFDTAVAYQLACTIFAHRAELMAISPVVEAMHIDNINKLTAVPLHPGVVRYLRDPQQPCVAESV